jgi:hypothetical protein
MVKDTQFICLQRVGSNFIEATLNKNIEGASFRSYVLITHNGGNFDKTYHANKHIFPAELKKFLDPEADIKPHNYIFLVRDPYMWVDSVCWNKETDKDFVKEMFDFGGFREYNVYDEPTIGETPHNLDNLLRLYKKYHSEWLEYIKSNDDFYMMKYEDYLFEDKAYTSTNKLVKYFGYGQVNSNFKLHDKPVRYSRSFTKEMFKYQQNQEPKNLSHEHIDKINSILGKGLIESLGYAYRG